MTFTLQGDPCHTPVASALVCNVWYNITEVFEHTEEGWDRRAGAAPFPPHATSLRQRFASLAIEDKVECLLLRRLAAGVTKDEASFAAWSLSNSPELCRISGEHPRVLPGKAPI